MLICICGHYRSGHNVEKDAFGVQVATSCNKCFCLHYRNIFT